MTFRRTANQVLFDRWLELLALMQTVSMTDSDDSPIWLFHSSGVYSVSSFYGIINNGGVIPVHTPAVWLIANNKLLARDNLQKTEESG
jgi:hypothetical protein